MSTADVLLWAAVTLCVLILSRLPFLERWTQRPIPAVDRESVAALVDQLVQMRAQLCAANERAEVAEDRAKDAEERVKELQGMVNQLLGRAGNDQGLVDGAQQTLRIMERQLAEARVEIESLRKALAAR